MNKYLDFDIKNLTNVSTTAKKERPGREIKLDGMRFGNPNLTFKLGTVEDKNRPHTVYINATYWVDIKNREHGDEDYDRNISKQYRKELNNIYKVQLKPLLIDNKIFPMYYENIYICEFPENLNYNSKRSFTSIELNLHTANCIDRDINYSLKDKLDNELFVEMMKVSEAISNTDLLKGKSDFSIHKNK